MSRSLGAIFGALTLALSLVLLPGLGGQAPSHAQTPQWEALGDPIPGGAVGDDSGTALALNALGTVLAIGSPQGEVTKPGVVRVYALIEGVWTQRGATLPGDANGDLFGAALDLSDDGNTLAIGAPRFANGEGARVGLVRVFSFRDGAWEPIGGDLVGQANGDNYGSAVALNASGSRLAVGAPAAPSTGDPATSAFGEVRVYDFASGAGAWTAVGSIIGGAAAGDNFGATLALSANGSRLIAGAPRHNPGGASLTGQARVFAFASSSWGQLGGGIVGDAAGDELGRAVDISADGATIAVGSPRHDTVGTNAGRVRVLSLGETTWTTVGDPLDGAAAGEHFGFSLALSAAGTRIVVGAPFAAELGAETGAVRSFGLVANSWQQRGQTLVGDAAGSRAGVAVGVNNAGTRIAFGAPGADTQTGLVRVWELPDPATPIAPARAGDHLAGISLHVAGPAPRAVEGSFVYIASYKIQPSSPFELSVRGPGGQEPRVLATGRVNTGGHLHQRSALPALEPGVHTITFTARHASGTGLVLHSVVEVGSSGEFLAIGENTHGIW